MLLTNADGKEFDLSPGVIFDIERTNPFFIEWGELSLPVTLPPTENNKRLLHILPDPASRNRNEKQRVNLQHGIFNMPAEMVLLSASETEGYECTLLLNEGCLNNLVADTLLTDIFSQEIIRFTSMGACLDYLRNLWIEGPNEKFAIFPVHTLPDSDKRILYINQPTNSPLADGFCDFYRRSETVITTKDSEITIPAGCYITPFVRLEYVLKKVFGHFNYTFDSGFLGQPPFKDMVLLNNTVDSIVTGKIKLSDLVPDCTVSTLMNVLRKKFCMEFVADEVLKKVSVVKFDDVLSASPSADLTGKVDGNLKIVFPENYRQLRLHSEATNHVIASSTDYREYETVPANDNDYLSLKKLYPEALLDQNSGTIYRLGIKGHNPVLEGIGSMNCDYFAGGSLLAEDISSDEKVPGMLCSKSVNGVTFWPPSPVIGKERYLYTKILLDREKEMATENEAQKGIIEKSNTEELPVMLCFSVHGTVPAHDIGTLANYYYDERLFDYTLFWNGPDGLFEKFWRKYDKLLRNSLHRISAQVLLTDAEKMQLTYTSPVSIKGQSLLPETLRYAVGDYNTSECDFLTMAMHKPVSEAPVQTWPAVSNYTWNVHYDIYPSKRYAQYPADPEVIYYAPPTEEEFTAGGHYHEKVYNVKITNDKDEAGNLINLIDGTLTVWLEAVVVNFSL